AEEAAREAVREKTDEELQAEDRPDTDARQRDAHRALTRDALQRMGPAVRKLVEEHDIDPGSIRGSGREGRVTKADVLDYLASSQPAATTGFEDDAPPAGERPAPVVDNRRE